METETSTGSEAVSARVRELSHSLRETASRGKVIEEATERLEAAGAEQAAATEQIRSSMESVATSIEETGSVAQSLARAQAGVSDLVKDVLLGLEGTTTGLNELK